MTVNDIAVVFETLRAGGLKPLFRTDEDILAAMRVWALVLSDITPEELMRAAIYYLRLPPSESKGFWPTPGKLLVLVPGREIDNDGDGAWGDLLYLVRKHGHYDGPRRPGGDGDGWTVDEQTWRGIQACGGWRELCMTTSSTMAAQRAAFRTAYISAGVRRVRQIEQRAACALLEERPGVKVVVPRPGLKSVKQ